MGERVKRQAVIAGLLAGGPVSTQEVLLGALAEAGVRTTQATLSRDLREMGVVKSPAGYVLPGPAGGVGLRVGVDAGRGWSPVPGVAQTNALERVLKAYLVSASAGVGQVVCKTAPGHAQVVALELDRTPPAGVLGTVGGDDTDFVAVDSTERVRTLRDELLQMAGLHA